MLKSLVQALNPGLLLDALPTGVVVHGPDTKIIYANRRALALLRLTPEQALGKDAMDPQWRFLDKHRMPLALEQFPVNRVLADGSCVDGLVVGIGDSTTHEITWAIVNAFPEVNDKGDIEHVVVAFADISQEMTHIPFRDVLGAVADAIVVTEAHPVVGEGPRIVYVNQAFTDITGFSAQEVQGLTPRILQGPDTDPAARAHIRAALERGEPVHQEILNYTRSGEQYWLDLRIVPLKNAYDELTHFAAIERDITSEKAREAELIQQATRDPLTDLLNRRGFDEVATLAVANTVRQRRPLSLAMIDIDHFKRINDSIGHAGGDLALQHLSQIMREAFRRNDVVARFGGEEFVVLLSGADLAHALSIMDAFRRKVSKSLVKLPGGATQAMTVSIGVACSNAGKPQIPALITQADAAMFEAKNRGRNLVWPKVGRA